MKVIDIMKVIKTPLEWLTNERIPTHYVGYIDLYDEYNRLVYKEGHKKSNAIMYLADIFPVSESTAQNIINHFEKEVGV
jgi:hypothetical protein